MSQSSSILFINQHYWPDWVATAQMLTDLAEHLAAEEMDVPVEETRSGVHIHWVQATVFGRETLLGCLTNYASSGASALTRALAGPVYDHIVTFTAPLPLPVVGAVTKRLWGQPYSIWSMDLHPDAAAGMSMEGGLPARWLHALNDMSYRTADFVVDRGSRMKRRLQGRAQVDE